MKASPTDQRRLLDIVALDERIRRADATRSKPPQAARVQELIAQRAAQSQEVSRLAGIRDDLRAELGRIEADVSVVDARSSRDAGRLAASSNPKEAQSLESEIAALAKRKRDLEDGELVVMERIESVETELAAQESLVADTSAEGARLSAAAKDAVAAATREIDDARRDRAAIANEIASDLVVFYEKIATRGASAGLLRRGTCESCRMVLAGTDMNVIRQAQADDVLTCPECGSILVRTEESGLTERGARSA